MRTRFYNAKILPMTDGQKIIEGEIWVEDSSILYVGEEKKESLERFDKEFDVKKNLIMPSFKNAHTHSAMTFGRSYADGLPCHEWLNKIIFPMEAKMSGEDIYWLSKLAFLEYIAGGITAVFDMYYEPEDMAKASIDTGFRTVMCGAINNFRESPSALEEYYKKYNQMDDLISYKLGIHAEYTTSKEIMCQVSDLVHKYEAPFFCHNSETKGEVEECIKRYGMTPTQLFYSLGLFDFGGGGFHCVYLDEKDYEVLKNCSLSVVTCPASNLKLASGIAPVEKLLENGIQVGIGTDGPSSNNCLNMFREMFLTTGLQKYKTNDAAACPASIVLEMATVNNAKIMGLNDCDVLAKGKKADLIIINLKQPNMQPENNIVSNIVYAGSNSNVKMTMVNGEILYENGQFNNKFDLEELYDKINKIVLALSR